VLTIMDLFYFYDSKMVLKGINLSLPSHKILSLIGPNGAGKSTLLKCCTGILRPSKGDIFINHFRLGDMSPRQLAREVAYVPQRLIINFPISVFDFVLTGRRPHIRGISPSPRDVEVALSVVKELGISHLLSKDMQQLSGGECQKVFFARALVQEPSYLLLDEATSNLDIYHQIEVMELVRSLCRQRGIGVLMAMHHINLAVRYSDEVVMLREGKIFAQGSPHHVVNEENIRTVYGIDSSIFNHQGELYVHPRGINTT